MAAAERASGILEQSVQHWTAGLGADAQGRALRVFRAIKDLPILDIHTHYATSQIAANTPWRTPSELFLGVPNVPGQGFDHYAATVMLGQGVAPELVYGRTSSAASVPDPKQEKLRFEAFVAALADAYPNPTSQWFELAVEEIFGLQIPLEARNAGDLWSAISERLRRPEFRPQELLSAHGIKVALTTDSPEDSLEHHEAHRRSQGSPVLLPTWRPDRALYPEENTRYPQGDFAAFVKQLSAAAKLQITSLQGFLDALKRRMDFFAAHGCRAADFGIENFPRTFEFKVEHAAWIFEKGVKGALVSPDEARSWKGFMLAWFALENARRGWVQYFHQGAARNINSAVLTAHGRDAGGDAPGEPIDRGAFAPFLNFLNAHSVPESPDGTGLARTVVFPINPEDYTYTIETIARFNGNNAGVRSKLQLGPPWWFNDTVENNAAVIRMIGERGLLSNWIGMLSDARCLPSVIVRIKQFRGILAAELVRILPRRSAEEIVPLAKRIAFENASQFLGGLL